MSARGGEGLERRYSLRVWLLAGGVLTAALAWAATALVREPLTLRSGLVFLASAIALTLAHFYPIKSTADNIEYTVSTAVLCAALLNLPPGTLLLAVLFSWGVWAWRNTPPLHRLLMAAFNAGSSCLSAGGAQWVLFALQARHLQPSLAAMAAALSFLVLHVAFMVLVMCIDRLQPPHKLGLWETDALLADAIMLLMGVIVGRLVHLDLWLVPVGCLPLLILYQYVGKLQLAKQAFIEPKTGLYNHRYFDTALALALRRARQGGTPVSIVFGDMDYLRQVNNTYGHLVGDEAIVAIGRLCKRLARTSDVPVRFGGEEFVLLLPETDKLGAAEVAERLRAAVAETTLRGAGYEVSLSMSIGVASYPADAESEHDLVKRADEAVYAAKHRGRNRVCVYGLDGVSG